MNIPKIAVIFGDVDGRYILEAAEEEIKMTKKYSRAKLLAAAAACVGIICLIAAGWALFDSKDYLRDYDVDPSYMTQDKMITSDGEGHYFGIIRTARGFRLLGSDGKNAYNICDVPGCDHTDGSVCKAITWPEYTGLSVYDGRLYWTARPKGDYPSGDLNAVEILSASPDGSDIKTVRTVPGDVFLGTQYNKYIRVHRGYMYFIGVQEPEMEFNPETLTSYQKDPDEKYVLNVYAEELKEGGENEKIFSLEYEDGRSYTYSSQFYANDLYIMVQSRSMENPEDTRFEVYRTDLKTHGGKLIYSTDKYDISGWWLDAAEDIYYTENDPETGKTALVRLDLGSGKVKKMSDLPTDLGIVINGKAVSLDGNAGKVYVTDFDGKTTELDIGGLIGQVESAYGYVGMSICGADGENVVLQMCDDECFAIVPLDGSEPEMIIASCLSDPGD